MLGTLSLTEYKNEEGRIIPLEFSRMPFKPKRIFWIHSVPPGAERGNHAHKKCHQMVFCLQGYCDIIARNPANGMGSECRLAGAHGLGTYVPPLTWLTLRNFREGTVILVLASHPYDPEDYINDFSDFEKRVHPVQQSPRVQQHHPRRTRRGV